MYGKRQWFPLGKVSKAEGEATSAQVDYLLLRLKQRLIELPPGVGIVESVQHNEKPPLSSVAVEGGAVALTLTASKDRYLDTHRESLEVRTIEGIELHLNYLLNSLGERFPIRDLKLADLQGSSMLEPGPRAWAVRGSSRP